MPTHIEVTDLRKSYGGRAVVDGVSLAVEEGEIFGILGPNGAGNPTLLSGQGKSDCRRGDPASREGMALKPRSSKCGDSELRDRWPGEGDGPGAITRTGDAER